MNIGVSSCPMKYRRRRDDVVVVDSLRVGLVFSRVRVPRAQVVFLRVHADSLFSLRSPPRWKRNDDDRYLIKFLFRHRYKHVKTGPTVVHSVSRSHYAVARLNSPTLKRNIYIYYLPVFLFSFLALFEHGSRINGSL